MFLSPWLILLCMSEAITGNPLAKIVLKDLEHNLNISSVISSRNAVRRLAATDYYLQTTGHCIVPITDASTCASAALDLDIGTYQFSSAFGPVFPDGCFSYGNVAVFFNTNGGPCNASAPLASCICENTPTPTSSPTISLAPTISVEPTVLPTYTVAPSFEPSPQPSATHAPTLTPTLFDRVGMKFTTETLRIAVSAWCSDKERAFEAYGDISGWDTSEVTDMSCLFSDDCEGGRLEGWNAKYCDTVDHFNEDISKWDVSNSKSFFRTFKGASSFDGDVSAWNVARSENFDGTFMFASSFTGDVSAWNVAKSTSFSATFYKASLFDGDVSKWNVSQSLDFTTMFYYASSFSGDLSSWDVSKAKSFLGMFTFALRFDSDVSAWEVGECEDFQGMFSYTENFNSDLGNWLVSNSITFRSMFEGATGFNQDLSPWDVSNSQSFNLMFHGASSFFQTLCWTLPPLDEDFFSDMFTLSSGSVDQTCDRCGVAEHRYVSQDATYVDMGSSDTNCSIGTALPGVAACEVAASRLGFVWGGNLYYSQQGYPHGCYSVDGVVFFNSAEETQESGNAGTRRICYNKSLETSCTNCTSGRYAEEPTTWSSGALSCFACPAGRYLPDKNGGSTVESCLPCSSGTFSFLASAACSKICPPGSYSDGNRGCFTCDTGSIAAEAGLDYCTSCAAGKRSSANLTVCEACEGGKFAAAGSGSCSECDENEYSLPESEECQRVCVAGSHVVSGKVCALCSSGRFASSGNIEKNCSVCPVGYMNSESGATGCASCSIGRIAATAGSTACTVCPEGTIAQGAASECQKCEAGKYSENMESSSCTKCPAGRATNKSGSVECSACPAGHFNPNDGASFCTECLKKYHSQSPGATACTACLSPLTTRGVGSINCSACEENYYWDMQKKSCEDCPPNGATCTNYSELLALKIDEGYYRFSKVSNKPYPCQYRGNCHGGKNYGGKSCSEGSKGPLCSLCRKDYYLDGAKNRCEKCENAIESPQVILLLVTISVIFMLCVGITIIVIRRKEEVVGFYKRHRSRLIDLSEKATAFVVAMQILVLLRGNHQNLEGAASLPKPYNAFLEDMSFLALDVMHFIPMSCIFGRVGHLANLLVWTVGSMIFVLGVVTTLFCVKRPSLQKWVLQKSCYVIILVLPLISQSIMKSFRCESYNRGESYDSFLFADLSIDCKSTLYTFVTTYATLNIIIWPVGVPICLMVGLSKLSEHLDPPGVSEARAIESRRKNEVLRGSAIAFIAMKYKPRYWYYPILDIVRRLMLTCVALVLKSRGQFIVFVLTVSLVTTVCEREMYPHIDPYLGAFVYLLSWQILLCVLALLVMDSEMTKDFESFFLGVVLLIVNIIMIGVVFLDTRGDIVRERIENNMAYLNRLNSVRVSLSPFNFGTRTNRTSLHSSSWSRKDSICVEFEGFDVQNPVHVFDKDEPSCTMPRSVDAVELKKVEATEEAIEPRGRSDSSSSIDYRV